MRPNALTSLFSHMATTCPRDIKNYATCVLDSHERDSLRRGVCEKEFLALRACFDKCRKKTGRR